MRMLPAMYKCRDSGSGTLRTKVLAAALTAALTVPRAADFKIRELEASRAVK